MYNRSEIHSRSTVSRLQNRVQVDWLVDSSQTYFRKNAAIGMMTNGAKLRELQ